MQRRTMSAVEAITNVIIGYAVAWMLTWTVLPLFGYAPSVSDTFSISAIFTAASLVRSYVLRRLFNRMGGSHG